MEQTLKERRAAYCNYLKSWKWAEIRAGILKRDGHECKKCHATTRLQVHHKWYPEVLGEEKPESLITLCHDCHMALHAPRPHKETKVVKVKKKRDKKPAPIPEKPVNPYEGWTLKPPSGLLVIEFWKPKHPRNFPLRMPFVCRFCQKRFVLEDDKDCHERTIHAKKMGKLARKAEIIPD